MSSASHPFASNDLALVLDGMREGIQVIDREWRYVFLNAAAAAHSRSRREDLIGRTMEECYPGISATPVFAVMRACMEGRDSRSVQNDFTYPDGVSRSFELRIQPCDAGIVVLSIVHHGILDSGIAYLQKPLVPEQLARRVREVLEAPAPRR